MINRYAAEIHINPIRFLRNDDFNNDGHIEDIKNTVLRYRPVIVPVSGKLLQNPQFLRGGPVYHTVLVIGYDDRDETFITHEPGTRFGKRYRYDQKNSITPSPTGTKGWALCQKRLL